MGYLYDGKDNNQTTNPTEQKLLYNYAYLNILPELSDLDYELLDLNINVGYKIRNNILLTLGYLYSVVDSKKDYVYGNEDGTLHTLAAAITYNF